ncbi:MAG: PKD domain-containing protein [Acidobacteriota bacterium]|nr:PKD domain-containing protein [Acidobacteriota bacterium]
MPTSIKTLAGILLLAGLAGCTNKVEIPALAGPSTLGYSILLTSNTTSLIQDGVSTATITITARDSNGQPLVGKQLRAAIMVGGVVQDYGTLSTKTPTTGGTITYTSPPASPIVGGQVAQTVTIAVTPIDSGDFLNELARGVDIQLVPQGVILPTNPALVAAFTVTPGSPAAFSQAVFDASSTTNAGVACLNNCSYAWNFGDGTTGTGLTTTHQYRTVGVFQPSLTVTDTRGAQATTIRSITVAVATPPSVTGITVSPSGGATVGQTLFFSAVATPAPGRTIARYAWSFGDGSSGSGSSTSHAYSSTGTFAVGLVVTDDVGAEGRSAASVTVGAGTPTGALTFLPAAPRVGQPVVFNASAITPATGATIVSYRFNYGDGSEEVGPQALQSHVYGAAGTVVARVTVTDSLGRTATATTTVTITP